MTRYTLTDRFMAAVVETAQDVLGRKMVATVSDEGPDEGRMVRLSSGFDRRVLARLYAKRWIALQAAMAQTDFGRAILAYLADRQTSVDFDSRMGESAITTAHNQIFLHAHTTDYELIGALAQETRHIWQLEQIGAVAAARLSPEADKVLHLLMEADAFSFEQKFLQDYARHTGNTAPLEVFMRVNRDAPPHEMNDTERFLAWAELIRTNFVYIDSALARGRTAKAHQARGGVLYDVGDLGQWAVTIARSIDKSWPLRDDKGDYASYLSSVDDTRIMAAADLVKRPPPARFWERHRGPS